MPDPITALSLASAVLQLVDFGSKMLVTGYKTYKSVDGVSDCNEHIEVLVADLRALHEKLAQRPSTATAGLSEDEAAIVELAGKSQRIARKLIALLEDLKVKGKGLLRSWEAVRKTIKATWKKEEIEILHRQLQDLQAQVDSRLLKVLR
jgi:hypothetical protein